MLYVDGDDDDVIVLLLLVVVVLVSLVLSTMLMFICVVGDVCKYRDDDVIVFAVDSGFIS